MSRPSVFHHESMPVYHSACEALVLLEQVAAALPPFWEPLARDQRAAGLGVIRALAEAGARSGSLRVGLFRQAFRQAGEAESALQVAVILQLAPGAPVPEASAAYRALGRSLRALVFGRR